MTAIPEQIGPYAVESELGRGGMGVVYLATDSRLDRKVAIKALPEHFAMDPERLARFEREAKILASLTHANIAGVYGLEEQEGARYLVMEFVEGESLQALMNKGPLAVDEALRIAVQVALGVEAAHDAGVIHRDLKPGNIVVTLQGAAKVLDFGLAKEVEGRGSSLDLSRSPTATLPRTPTHETAAGQVVGTAAYLSPEQARGKALDKRTDIWAFGCVLYEMLTGESPYAGETMTDSLGAILHKDPEWSLLPPDTPATIQLLLRRCLAKDANRRLRDIGDARVEIEEALRDPSGTSLNLAGAALAAPAKATAGSRIGWVVAAIFAAGAVALGAMTLMAPAPEAPLVQRYALPLPNGATLRPSFVPVFDVSNDGRFVVYSAVNRDGDNMLYRRDVDQMDATALAGSNDAEGPVISPDGQWIVYVQSDQLKKVSIRGGPALTLAQEIIPGVAWGVDGSITMASGPGSVLQRVSENGGDIVTFESTAESATQSRPIFPQPLPGGGVLYTALGGSFGGDVMAIQDAESEPVLVVENGAMAMATGSGHLLFERDGALMVATFDEKNFKITSQPLPLFEDLLGNSNSRVAHYAVSSNGALLHIPGAMSQTGGSLVYIDMEGQAKALPVQSAIYSEVALSPDESRVAIRGVRTGDSVSDMSLWVLEIERDILTKLSGDASLIGPVHWSPDGEWIYGTTEMEDGVTEAVYRYRSDGSGSVEFIASSGRLLTVSSISADGNRLYCTRRPDSEVGDQRDVVVVDLVDPDKPVTELFGGPGHQDTPRVSPDGRWVAYEDGAAAATHDQIYVARADGVGGRVQISRQQGNEPRWAPDGSKIYFSDASDEVFSVVDVLSTETDDEFRVSAPRELFTLPSATEIHQVTPGGGRFLAVSYATDETSAGNDHILVALNIFEELNRLAPTQGGK